MNDLEQKLKALELFNTAFEKYGKGLEEFRDSLDKSIKALNSFAEVAEEAQQQVDYKNSLKNDY